MPAGESPVETAETPPQSVEDTTDEEDPQVPAPTPPLEPVSGTDPS
jgi:hypothetical protein